ncbi:MAG TPA: SMP-30/gluconolactonase/LRE family protein [Polyangia bacterium]|nr:SMP-30/gluconolactonase/LRE family protein [Polyangia bacterium]
MRYALYFLRLGRCIFAVAALAACGTGSSNQSGAGGGHGGSAGVSGGTGGTGQGGLGAGGQSGGTGAGLGGNFAGTGGGAGGPAAGAGGGNASWSCPAGPFTTPTPSGIVLSRVAGVPPVDSVDMNWGFAIIEGPVWFGDALYVSEVSSQSQPPYSRILKITATDTVSVVYPDAGTNGLATDGSRLIGGNHKIGGISAINLAAMTEMTLVSTYNGARFDSPNDLTIRRDGTIYFSDPSYQAPSTSPQGSERLYRLPPGASTAVVLDASRARPNGVTLSLDETKLYVTDTTGLYQYPVNSDGTVGTATRVASNSISAGDGMAIDCQGNVYVASNSSLIVVSPAGTVIGSIDLSSKVQSVSNAAFGGADHKTLYVVGLGNISSGGGTGAGLFKAQMPLPGMPY